MDEEQRARMLDKIRKALRVDMMAGIPVIIRRGENENDNPGKFLGDCTADDLLQVQNLNTSADTVFVDYLEAVGRFMQDEGYPSDRTLAGVLYPDEDRKWDLHKKADTSISRDEEA